MKSRDVQRSLRRHGCVFAFKRGDHEKWLCPCGKHIAIITAPGEVSAGVVADTIKKLSCLPKGWLQ